MLKLIKYYDKDQIQRDPELKIIMKWKENPYKQNCMILLNLVKSF